MKRATLLAIVSLACVAIIISLAFAQTKGPGFSAPVVEGQWYDNSIALVVGINSYSHGWNQLSKAVSDGKKTAAEES